MSKTTLDFLSPTLFLALKNIFAKKMIFFVFLVFFICADIKNNFFYKKYDVFTSKKYFENQ
jgi:hypothetical protein